MAPWKARSRLEVGVLTPSQHRWPEVRRDDPGAPAFSDPRQKCFRIPESHLYLFGTSLFIGQVDITFMSSKARKRVATSRVLTNGPDSSDEEGAHKYFARHPSASGPSSSAAGASKLTKQASKQTLGGECRVCFQCFIARPRSTSLRALTLMQI